MDSILIKGGKPLIGEIEVSGSKNASLPIMAATLLTAETMYLSNVPTKISDIKTMASLLENHGTKIDCAKSIEENYSIKLNSEQLDCYTAPYDIVRKMRASIWVLGPLLGRFGKAKVSFPGGCAIGTRQVDMHLEAMRALGASVKIKNGYIYARSEGRLQACEFSFSQISVGATINAILAAVLAQGKSIFANCAREPEIVDLCNCLNKMGAEITGIGSATLTIIGKKALFGTVHRVMSDRIEAGTYMLIAAATRGKINIRGISYEVVRNLGEKMLEAGSKITVYDDGLEVQHQGDIKPVDIFTAPYPGFATDLQAQFMSFMTLASGKTIIAENIFDNRFMHVPELCRMGANISIKGNQALVIGVESLTGAEVMASDLRASVSLVMSGLCATGETRVKRVYHLDRGYEALEQKLSNCGAEIRRLTGDTV